MLYKILISTACWMVLSQLPGHQDVRADGASQKNVQALLDNGWIEQREGLKLAEQIVQKAQSLGEDDPRLRYAYGLVLLRHRCYDDAAAQLEAACSELPTYLPAWKTRTWLHVARKSYANALTDLEELACIIASNDANTATRHTARCAGLIGALIGYIEGPGCVNGDMLERTKAKIQDRLGPDDKIVYEKARSRVLKQHTLLTESITPIQQQELQLEREQKAASKLQIATQENDVRRGIEQTEYALQQLQLSFQEQSSDLAERAASLKVEFAGLHTRARAIGSSIGSIKNEIAELLILRDKAIEDGDHDLAKMYQRSIDSLNIDLVSLRREYAGLDGRAAAVRREAWQVGVQYRNTDREYQCERRKLLKNLKLLARQEKQIAAGRKEAAKPATGNTVRVRDLHRKASSLRTYVRFNLDTAKQSLLRSLAPHAPATGTELLTRVSK